MSELTPMPEDITLRFVVDGVYYALKQNIYDEGSRKALEAKLVEWIPSAEIVEIPEPKENDMYWYEKDNDPED